MLGGLTLFVLGLLGYLQAPFWLVLPVALAGAVLKPLAERGAAPVWTWRAALRALPLVLVFVSAAFGLGWSVAHTGL